MLSITCGIIGGMAGAGALGAGMDCWVSDTEALEFDTIEPISAAFSALSAALAAYLMRASSCWANFVATSRGVALESIYYNIFLETNFDFFRDLNTFPVCRSEYASQSSRPKAWGSLFICVR